MGVLMWPPGEFWTACPSDFFAAFDGWLEAHGLKGNEPMDRERMNQLIEAQAKTKKAEKPPNTTKEN